QIVGALLGFEDLGLVGHAAVLGDLDDVVLADPDGHQRALADVAGGLGAVDLNLQVDHFLVGLGIAVGAAGIERAGVGEALAEVVGDVLHGRDADAALVLHQDVALGAGGGDRDLGGRRGGVGVGQPAQAQQAHKVHDVGG